ncbi:MAG: hypothetical protein ACLU8J_12015 [Acutalibacter sp.]
MTTSASWVLPASSSGSWGGKLPPDIAFLLRMYCEGSIHMTVDG